MSEFEKNFEGIHNRKMTAEDKDNFLDGMTKLRLLELDNLRNNISNGNFQYLQQQEYKD